MGVALTGFLGDNLNHTQLVFPTGQSVIFTSTHYKDQVPLFNNGEYRTTCFDEGDIRTNQKFKRMILTPKG